VVAEVAAAAASVAVDAAEAVAADGAGSQRPGPSAALLLRER
jgi:hypothetical protein